MTALDLFPLYLTAKVASVSTLCTVTIGLGMAWLLAKRRFRGKEFVDALLMQPLIIPPTVLGYYLLVLLGRGSVLGRAMDAIGLPLVFTWRGAVVAATVASLPLFIKPARAALEGVDPKVEHAARLLGRSEWGVARTITLPLAWRGILAGTLLAFARAAGDFGATLMVAGNIPGRTQTLAIAIYDAVQADNLLLANTLVVIITVFSVTLLFVVNRFTGGKY
jgi:molybdate transport system permease protein